MPGMIQASSCNSWIMEPPKPGELFATGVISFSGSRRCGFFKAVNRCHVQAVRIGYLKFWLDSSKEVSSMPAVDFSMPSMNGFELCSKLRSLPQHKKTPVVFVTSLNDFESRTSSTMAGGNDFIGKPFLFIELTVKALIHVMRAQYQPKTASLY